MTAQIIDGKNIAAKIRHQLAEEIKLLNIQPCLAVVLVGNNPASLSYVSGKEKACKEVGISTKQITFPDSISENQLIDCIKQLNDDSTVHGILVQLPLPKHIDSQNVIDAISTSKDVDGFTSINAGKLLQGKSCFLPCTPYGILKLLEYSNVEVNGKHIVVVGRSNIVGKPIANLLLQKEYNATVTICHTGTPDISIFTKQADIVVVATGKPNTIVGDMLKPSAVVIDVGVNRIEDATRSKGFRLVGDVDFESCKNVASMITPVPGGVGPMTIAMLLHNTVQACKCLL